MPLAPGTKLGPYEIVGPLGAGGMGEVYRAKDTKLKREVALKVLPELFANDEQRMLRFAHEAEVLASLNHPNIAHIHGLEEASGGRALVMELVEGPTLAERISQGPLGLEEAVLLAKQIAEGLEYAHDRGIIHRDLKPSNVKVTPDGVVKILDFGLAKALQRDGGGGSVSTSPTISVAATSAGLLLGTAGYMSPEQAKGKSVDRRADIWAFGCVLFEMLAGKPAFEGETITDKLAAVVRGEPEWTQLPDKTSNRIRELLQRCLQKDLKQRLQAIGEARIAIEKYLAYARRTSGRYHGSDEEAGESLRRLWCVRVFGGNSVGRPVLDSPSGEASCCGLLYQGNAKFEFSPYRSEFGIRSLPGRPSFGLCGPGRRRQVLIMGPSARFAAGSALGGNRWGCVSLLVARQPIHRLFCGEQAQENRRLRWSAPDTLRCPAPARWLVESGRGDPVHPQRERANSPGLLVWRCGNSRDHPGSLEE